MFCCLQAVEKDFSFQHLALMLFAGCLVPKGKLWWLVLGGTAGHEPASRSIPVPPFIPTHMGLSAPWTGCGTASVSSPEHLHGAEFAEFCVLLAIPAIPEHEGIKSSICLRHCLPSPSPGVLWGSRDSLLRMGGTAPPGMGEVCLSPHQQAAPWKGQ